MNKFSRSILLLVITLGSFHSVFSQNETEEKLKHHHVVVSIGHSNINSGNKVNNGSNRVSVPTWGFTYEYIFTEKIGLSIKNDIEISDYVITDNNDTEIERENPFSSSLILSYNPIKGLGIFTGPGIELEKEENYFIYTIGLSYEIEFGNEWDLSPELAYELKGGHTGAVSIGLTVGKKFGK